MIELQVNPTAPTRPSHVRIGRGQRFRPEVRGEGALPSERRFLLHDEDLTGEAIAITAAAPDLERIPWPGGEGAKTLSGVEALAARLMNGGATRRSTLIVLGGGSLCDLGAFTAAIFMRGIDCVLIPSTLLAMVDAAIGGKNGVDLGDIKNVVGTIRQPALTVVDPELLATLPSDRLREGLVEMIKIAAILDADRFANLERDVEAVLGGDTDRTDERIADAVRLKVAVIEEDEREQGSRILLNFGHTVGHAIETASGFTVSHGQAVSWGMRVESRMARSAAADRIEAVLDRLELKMPPAAALAAGPLWQAMTRDKKRLLGRIRIAVPEAVGRGVVQTVREEDLARALSC